MLTAKGHNGQVTVDGSWITIERKGLGRVGHSKGERKIPIGAVSAVQVRPAGRIGNGFIAFTTPGAPPFSGGLSEAAKHSDAVIFTRKQQEAFDAVREHVETVIAQRYA